MFIVDHWFSHVLCHWQVYNGRKEIPSENVHCKLTVQMCILPLKIYNGTSIKKCPCEQKEQICNLLLCYSRSRHMPMRDLSSGKDNWLLLFQVKFRFCCILKGVLAWLLHKCVALRRTTYSASAT